MRIVFAGGGSLGPVTPLLAVARRMKKLRPNIEFAWIGTVDGPERAVIERERIPFYSIRTVKLPRYVSWDWLTWPRDYLQAKKEAVKLVKKLSPSLVIGAGGFTQTPVIRGAKKLRIPCAVHQLDVEPGLSNKASAGLCASVTTSFAYAVSPFRGVKAERVATPTRFANITIPDSEAAASRFFLEPSKPIVFVLGGGQGAVAINHAVSDMVRDGALDAFQIIHSVGAGKMGDAKAERGYVVRELFDEQDTLFAYAAADLVVSRAGIGTLSELAALRKAAVVIPMPKTHQEQNVSALTAGVVYLPQTDHLSQDLRRTCEDLLGDNMRREQLGDSLHGLLPTDDGSSLAARWLQLAG